MKEKSRKFFFPLIKTKHKKKEFTALLKELAKLAVSLSRL